MIANRKPIIQPWLDASGLPWRRAREMGKDGEGV